nr:putative ubiquitin carboxy-terminal hydrolase [Megavirus caiporensis]
MCINPKNETSPIYPITPSIIKSIPTTSIIPKPIVIPPKIKLQTIPILDESGKIPIANQMWDGTEYIRITNKANFINITTTTDINLSKYVSKFVKPIINNIVDITFNRGFDITKVMSVYNFNVENARALANFGNSCYFGVSMQLLFVMYDLRTMIVTNTNFLQPNFPTPINVTKSSMITAYDNIKDLLIEMNLSPKTTPVTIFSNYKLVKQNIFDLPSVTLVEEDAEEFISFFTSRLRNEIRDLFLMKGVREYYRAGDGQLISSTPYEFSFNFINYDIIKSNLNATLEQTLYQLHNEIDLIEGSESLYNPITGDYEIGYAHYQVNTLPQYLLIRLEMVDPNTNIKQKNNIQINTTLTLTTNSGQSVTYLAMAMIMHRGNTIDTGHYTALVYDNAYSGNLEYIFYDDQISTKYNIPSNTKIIPSNLYVKNITDAPYVIMYADITKLQ